jgi:two-component system sensor histidine kinase TctE
MIEADKVRMKMLIDNLLDNAIRFSSRGGRVTLKVETTDNGVVLAVEDSGPGIPQEERESVFRRFYRVLGSPGEGSGLGLSIVKEIAIAHGATIILDEPEDHPGTLVKILLPKLHDLA